MEVREREFSLTRAGETSAVEPKAFRVLLILLRKPGKLIPKQELLDAVWGDAAVTENSLARAVGLLRKLLGDEAHSPRYIETVASVGYRWVCKVEVAEVGDESPEVPKEKRRSTSFLKWLLASAVVLVVGLSAAVWYLLHPLPPPHIAEHTKITHDGRKKFLVGTDGVRLYFNQVSPTSIAQVGVTGGEIALIPVAVPHFNHLVDVSPDGSGFLVASPIEGHTGSELWSVRMLGGSFRRLVDAAIVDAGFSPDGILVALLNATRRHLPRAERRNRTTQIGHARS